MKLFINRFSLFSAIACSVLIGFTACEKDDNPTSAREQQLTAKEWKITDITRPKISNVLQDSSILKACTSDDRISFGRNGINRTFQLKDNTTRCDSTIFFYDGGIWALNAAQDQVQLNGARRMQKWTILVLNDSVMKVQWRDSISLSNNVVKTIFFKNN